MTDQQARNERLALTNPLLGKPRLKLGTFCSNVSSGATLADVEGGLDLTWENTAKISRMADEMKFEAVVPIGRWRGLGGRTDPNRDSFESMTFAAGVGATTSFPAAFATVHVPSIHPVMAAKQATTIDHITGGRFGLNIVTGWNEQEMALFGSSLLPHDQRYEVAAEWITLMKMLWTADEPVDFAGKYYTVEGAFLRPKPIQPYPLLMSAGASPAGRAFAAEHCDVAFTNFGERTLPAMRAQVDKFRSLAQEKFGRSLQVWTNTYVIMGDSEADAQAYFDHIVNDCGDFEAVDNLFGLMGLNNNNQSYSPEILAQVRNDFVAGWGGYKIQGTKERVVEELEMLVEAGVDGVLLAWPAFIEGMAQFQREVLPMLVARGLR
ncbi:LLM class flavin-dependent oxidoreductase [Sphingobium fuliginis]|uniref:LLM class flavin-dependent oxidoreductase n=1 Tax=Sphingobium fuliginis ATCC 27551 TaxID=1208342 RepID=A0A5B8CLR5_SPHSA|nr:LLM class flavin-dependent oxidoreductase [Sphingobium fuliginis]QDC39636.1 LLM class flavin-dependent oxidoreductase [Sphingobium fuliginis ATCC 27551]